MAVPNRLVVLPAAFAELAAAFAAAGLEVLIDCTADSAEVPPGAWVRARSATHAPGTGPLVVQEGKPDPSRPTWLERTTAGAPPAGFAGVMLRGLGSGGRAGRHDVRELLAEMPAGVAVLVDWPHPPEVPLPAGVGLVLSDVLLAHLPLAEGLHGRLARLSAADFRRFGDQNLVASLASPAWRRVAAGEAVEEVAAGVYTSGDAYASAWPIGAGALHAAGLYRRHADVGAAVRAYGARPRAVEVSAPASAPPAPAVDEAHVPFERNEPIAVIGLGCRLPRSPSVSRLWENLVAGFDGIIEVPRERWDPALYWDADKSVPDKTYARIGGFVTDFVFNPKRFRIPPSVARLVDPIQQMALEAAADALEDAGYGESRDYDRARVATILGNSMGGEITDEYTIRVMFPAIRKALTEVKGFAALPTDDRAAILAAYEEQLKRNLPPITEDSMPGELANVVAGRITNALNLGGPNFTTDAACAGSMAAMQAAVKGLQDGDFDMAVTGGADRSMGVATYAKFSKIGALSPDGSRPFDADANGFVMGEGVGILVLRRLSDALRDGDRVYAVLRGFGGSSDGKGKGITAPNPEGQKRALHRAYENAGIDPADVDLFECHGTSTVVGDKVEVDALSELVGSGRRNRPSRIGSVKSNIGHLKSAAGAASALKVCLALHHGVFPPSINYKKPRPDIDLGRVPLKVQTITEAWEGNGPRFAGISSFGFGGTNFHVVLEGFRPGMARASSPDAPAASWPPRSHSVLAPANPPPAAPVAVAAPAGRKPQAPVNQVERAPSVVPVPTGLWALSADTPEEMVERCTALAERGEAAPYEGDAPLRVSAHAQNQEELVGQLEKVVSAVRKGKGYDLVRQRGIALEDVPCDGELAFLFTGQGSQYIGMGLDLAEQFPVVAATFAEADEVMTPLLGRSLTSLIRRDDALSEEEQFERLRDTAISQPATLTVDVAILRLMSAYGVRPDMVAGHSLGEYGALVAAGILTFREALVAVSARGREMAAVKLDDVGKMAGIAASTDVVMEVLAEVPGYVVPANKNCPTQTVIAGESDAVEAASELFKSRGITVYPLPVSHAFHSRIVAPASEPLKRVLQQLDIREPRRRVTTNVDSRYYPTGPGAREQIIENLALQVAAPVEWIAQVERMYADGARIFVECGPKRALSGFVVQILKHRPHRALYTNQPKRGGASSFLDALAELFVLGFPIAARPEGSTDIFGTSGPRRSTTPLLAARNSTPSVAAEAERVGTPEIARTILDVVARRTGIAVEDLSLDHDVEADLGIDTVKMADVIGTVRETLRLDPDPDFRMGQHRTLRQLVDYAARRSGFTRPSTMPERRGTSELGALPAPVAAPTVGAPTLPADSAARFLKEIAGQDLRGVDGSTFATAMLPALQGFLGAAWTAFQAAQAPVVVAAAPPPAPVRPAAPAAAPAPAERPAPVARAEIVCSGASLGLPGGTEVFEVDGIQRMLRGENRIGSVDETNLDRFLDKKLMRLTKDPQTGEGSFLPVESRDQVIRLAGRKSHFDLIADYGVDPGLARSLDITTQLAFAAAIEALRDAGIPLVRTYRHTTTGKDVATGWALPEAFRDGTGIVFASAFPGYDQLVGKLGENGGDGEGHFDRRFLFQVLSMGHSQLAQFLGARGPNTAVNAACASTTQAIAVAEDWLRLGRCERVIVVGADDVTSENLLQWIGAGFMAAGAATTTAEVENAALPFDRRRHGMILGMGAVGLVLERGPDVRARGMVPIAELLATHLANSAFHGTRLDASHIAREVKALVDRAVAASGVSHQTFAESCVFLSHETYTPARGGSAAAEMASLPNAFGAAASKVVIANTKGFTGHPMGAGVEDTVAIKSLQYQLVPPIPNLKERDPDLGELTLSTGGHYDIRYALRLAAGFGSQLALVAWKKVANGDVRVSDAAVYGQWLARVGGAPGTTMLENRQLRFVPDPNAARAAAPAAPAAPAPAAAAPKGSVSGAEVLQRLIGVVAQKTGYSREEIDPSYELEADLGIDTVKQAEIFAEVRDAYGLERDDSFKLADYPTVEKLAGWLASRAAGAITAVDAAAPAPAAAAPAPAAASPGVDRAEVLQRLITVVAAKTGYDVGEIDPGYELEADLGIDTVKQAEIFAEVRDAYGLERDDSFKLADYPTVAKLAGWLADKAAGAAPAPAPAPVAAPVPTPTPSAVAPPASLPASAPAEAAHAGHTEVLARLIGVVAARTGYEPSEIDPNYELEADLGIDTVKQAEIFGEVRDAYALERDDSFRLADYPTVDKLAGWLAGRIAAKAGAAEPVEAPAPAVAASVAAPAAVPEAVAPAPEAAVPTLLPHQLPPDFRVRRVVRVSHVKLPVSTLRGQVVWVLGGGELGEHLRDEIRNAGGRSEGDPDVVVDCGAPLLELFAQAQRLDGRRPRQWLSILTPPADLKAARDNGARAGLCKALGREWEGCRARVVSVRANWPELDAARAIVDEMGEGDAANEVWIGPAERDVAALAVETVPTEGHWPEHPVVILTGGTRGITAQVALELARRGPCTLVLVARTLPGLLPLDEEKERPLIRQALEATNKRVTPKMIEDRLKPLRVSEEARQNVEAMIALGALVELRALDLANPDAVRLAVAELRMKHPRIDLVVHGAGVEESRLLTDKDETAFRRVFDGKAEGGLALAEGLDASTFFVSMGSIAGRFGNAGQVDYSAANEAMAQVCLARPRSLHLAWTAWAGVGMAVRGGMESLLTSRGVELLPPQAGARLLCDLVASGVCGELVVAGRLGDFQSPSIHPLLDSVELVGDRAIGRRRMSVETDPWILDHAIDNVPVLPGVMGLEMMVGAALASDPRGRFVGFEDVTFSAPLKLHRDQAADIEVTAEPDEEGAWRCTLSSSRTLKNGRTQVTRHFEARVQLVEMPLLPALPGAWFPEERVSQKDIYRRFFHGARFQVLRAAEAVTVQGLLAEAVVEHGSIAEGLISEPLVLESAFQAAGLHRIALEGVMALPASIDAVELVRSAVEGESLQVVVHVRGGGYDIDVDGPEGRIMRVRGFRMVEKGPLPPGDRLPVPEGGWPSASIAASSESEALPPGDREKMEARGTAKRRADRVAGQLAALRAVEALEPGAALAVDREPGGRPIVVGGPPRLEVSITHTDGEALALAVRGARAGVDMEAITPRPASFVEEWFSETERGWAHTDEAITVVWSVKEAVLKALGVGMALNPREIEVVGVEAGVATVRLSGEVLAAHTALGGAPIRVRVGMHAGRVVVTAVFAA